MKLVFARTLRRESSALILVEAFDSTLHSWNHGDELLIRDPFDMSQCPRLATDLRLLLQLNEQTMQPSQLRLMGAWVSGFQRAIEERAHRFQGEPSFNKSKQSGSQLLLQMVLLSDQLKDSGKLKIALLKAAKMI